MNFLQIQDFLAVVEHESITGAAEALCVTQQTLSGHMAALEEELGCRLFQRRPRFCLTYQGKRFYQYACRFAETRRAMEQEFADIRREEMGVLRIGISSIRGKAWIPPLTADYHRRFPKMELQVTEEANEVLIQRLLSGTLDLILGYLPETMPELCIEELYRETMLLVMPRRYLTEAKRQALRSGDLRALSECRFLMNPPEDNAGRVGRQLLRQAGILPRITVTADSTELLLRLCLQGEGVCFCPDFMAGAVLTEQEREKLSFYPVGESYPVSLAWQRGQYTSRHILELRDAFLRIKK